MDLGDRIARRRTSRGGAGVFVDRELVTPAVHPAEPVDRGPVLERMLDALDPVFDGELPPDVAVVGPPGSGKSAVVTALFAALDDALGGADRTIGTTTRTDPRETTTRFVTVDARDTHSEFALYRELLAAISSDAVPESGIGTDALRDRLVTQMNRPNRHAVVAIDHHDEPEALTDRRVRELLDPIADRVSVVAVGTDVPTGGDREYDGGRVYDRERGGDRAQEGDGSDSSAERDGSAAPGGTGPWEGPVVRVPPYRHHELVDVLTERASEGLAPGALDHESTRDLAIWADGNAHDALAALFGAAVLATEDGVDRIGPEHLRAAMDDVPTDGVHVARALSLPANRQRVLRGLIELDSSDRPLRDVAEEIAAESALTAGTVTRFLYELADSGVVERIPLTSTGGGRRPSAVAPRFPTIAFRALSTADGTDY